MEELHSALDAQDQDRAGGIGGTGGSYPYIDENDPVEVGAAQFKKIVASMSVNNGEGFVSTFEELQATDRKTFVPSACSEGAKLYNKPLNRCVVGPFLGMLLLHDTIVGMSRTLVLQW